MSLAILFSAMFSNFLTYALGQATSTYSVQLLATSTANPGGPGTDLSNYPRCAQMCGENVAPLNICPRNPPNAECECGAYNRGNVSACEVTICNDADYLRSAELATDLCDPVYKANPSISAAASSAIASATSSARAVLATKNPSNLADYPACGQSCIPPALTAGGCRGLTDIECVCHCAAVDASAGSCEVATCPKGDLPLLITLVESLCNPVGGVQPKIPGACRNRNYSTPTGFTGGNGTVPAPTGVVPPVATFTAGGTFVRGGMVAVLGGVLACAMVTLW